MSLSAPFRQPGPPPSPVLAPTALVDGQARRISYLRVSVTDRCDLRCSYCMAEKMTFLPRAEVLSLEELDRVCSAFVAMGVEKLRVTGGEPLVRRDVMAFFRAMSRHLASGALRELTLTTNGTQLERFAWELADCGVRRVNVSLDTLDADKFARITRLGSLAPVLTGIAAAQAAGLRVKINTVALKGVNEDELFLLTDWCGAQGFDLTFIEVMPMGAGLGDDRFWPLSDLRARLESRYSLVDTAETSGGPARYVRVDGGGQKIGFITPLSHNFCASCNRVRLSCTGELFSCLGQTGKTDLRGLLRGSPKDDAVIAAIARAIGQKTGGHGFDPVARGGGAIARMMSHTGG